MWPLLNGFKKGIHNITKRHKALLINNEVLSISSESIEAPCMENDDIRNIIRVKTTAMFAEICQINERIFDLFEISKATQSIERTITGLIV